MAEPFKNLLNEEVIAGIAEHLAKHCPAFSADSFTAMACVNLNALELKQRSRQITQALVESLPADFTQSAEVLTSSLGTPLGDDLSVGTIDKHGISGWAVMPMADYVSERGMQHFELSMQLLKAMTKCFSSEFAIRPFIEAHSEQTMTELLIGCCDENPHVRRLASEGCRPRLPWATQLPAFIKEPAPVLVVLEALKDDPHEYVRRSVANNLNDIAKDHPELIARIAKRWLVDATPERKKLIRHGCRTLIKQGHQPTLEALGYSSPELSNVRLNLSANTLRLGESIELELGLTSRSVNEQALLVDYAVHHQKANGTTTPKVFKWREVQLMAKQTAVIRKKHRIKKITTRVYYPGEHRIEVFINGVSSAEARFSLTVI